MQTIIKPGILKILRIFYSNGNKPVHLREIARSSHMNESTASMHLNSLVKKGILKAAVEGNLKKFYISKDFTPVILPLFDYERLENLPLLRKNAIKIYLKSLETKPLLAVVFGSTAKGNFKNDSDIDILEVSNSKDNRSKRVVEAQTGVHMQVFRIGEKQFIEELKLKKDNVVQSALNTGFPVFNQKY